jgi:hypothetical protein
MALDQDLLTLEKGFWTEGGDYYRDHVDDECLVAFEGMAGVHSNEEIAGMNPGAGNWTGARLEEKGLIKTSEDSVILTYEARATKKDGTPHHALCSTGYVKHDGEWKMVFHQQTPIGAET